LRRIRTPSGIPIPGETATDHGGDRSDAKDHEAGKFHRTGEQPECPAKAGHKGGQDQEADGVSDMHDGHRAATAAGELASVSQRAPTEAESGVAGRLSHEFELRLKEWRQELDASAAEELLAAAIVVGAADGEEVRAAARLIAEDQGSLSGSVDIARSVLGRPDPNNHEPLSDETAKMHLEIARRKRLLRIYPRDALLLTETALQYTNLGMNDPASHLLKVATAVLQIVVTYSDL
jgi:hypothetical protein